MQSTWCLSTEQHQHRRPVLYVGRHSHCMYRTAGIQWRMLGFAPDRTAKGLLWRPHVELLHPYRRNPVHYWAHYSGRVYRGGGLMPTFRPMWLRNINDGLRARTVGRVLGG